ncbi:hypothetical protein FHU35_11518 [Saccharopolyspora dendranthemae]|uniref:Uncharacterized protein n=1 Tax=Saccharopolyspora dendranthemae TaxID=1181886 RepID=A0A561V8F3_9PSEU|nr:hypothetical protein FHU35_11518 [Saccharopolyspora dendranthemae]
MSTSAPNRIPGDRDAARPRTEIHPDLTTTDNRGEAVRR